MKSKKEEFLKCATSPVYYIDNYGVNFNIFTQKVDKITCFDYQKELLKKYLKYRNNIVLKSRQTGISLITAGYVAWKAIFRPYQHILIVANNLENSTRFLKQVKNFYYNTPAFLSPGEPVIDNQKNIVLPNGSQIIAKSSSPDAGRGYSLTLLVVDEAAFVEYFEDIWTSAGLALSVTQGQSIIISTPNGTDNLYYRLWSQAIENKNPSPETDFICSIVHWKDNPFCSVGLEERIDENGEVKYWSPWYEEQCQKLNYNQQKIAQELDLSFLSSKNLVIEQETINKYEKRLLTEEYQEVIKNAVYYDYKELSNKFVKYATNFIIYSLPQKEETYIVACDIARGDSLDYTAIVVIAHHALEVVADFFDKIPIELTAELIYNIAKDYNSAFVVVEANNFGLGVALDLKNKYEYPNLYYSKNIKDIYVRPYHFKVGKDDIIPGFQTTKKTRPLIINSLKNYLREGELKIYSERIINQFKTFVYHKDRAEAEYGANDDLIMALAIGLYIRDTEYIMLETTQAQIVADIQTFEVKTTTLQNNKPITQIEKEMMDKEKLFQEFYYLCDIKDKLSEEETRNNNIIF